ncbi:uncharacterized protein Dana_GF26297 [Drosophila ananassae]|uniref:Uncharacterized protein n=1 Tax=Drosophila ananassae TaxID=7217 RepID=A0A0N8P011_DROAN|nr:uncharacterized protein LOC26513706 [Drosophila ananassae]KPU75828.1 uncharacterized protein Dana_GF26297 [Drosophila ananassae]
MFAKAKPRTPFVNTQLRQTKLCVSQKDHKLKYEGFVPEAPKLRPKVEFVYMPTPHSLPPPSNKVLEKSLLSAPLPPKKVLQGTYQKKDTTNKEDVLALMSKGGRDLINLIGRVEFSLKTHKMYPHLNVIWNVYGKLLRIIKGKRGENTLLVRNENSGPILQGIYYDFDGDLETLNTGKFEFFHIKLF